jgi:hypothetical protein
MLLHEGRESSAIQAVRFSPDGGCLAVATSSGQVRWFEAGEWITSRGGCDSGIEIDDIAFSSGGERLAVIGRAGGPDRGYPESELTVLLLEPFAVAPAARHRIPAEVDGRMAAELFAAPTFLPRQFRSYPLLVGTADGVLGIDPASGAARFRLATELGFGFVTRRGLVYLPASETLLVAFDMHPGLWLIAYQRDARGRFRELRQIDEWGREHHAGAALGPSGRRLAVAVQDDFYLHPAEAGLDARLGAIHVYETDGLSRFGTFEVRAVIEGDFGRQDLAPGDGRRMPRGGGPDSPFMYLPLALMSNPAFLDERRVAFGMPGGAVRLLDVESGAVETVADGPRAAVSGLDCTAAKNLLAAGFADGAVRVWRI